MKKLSYSEEFPDAPDQYDLAGVPRESGKKYLINTRIEIAPVECEFCSEPCNTDWCYTKDVK